MNACIQELIHDPVAADRRHAQMWPSRRAAEQLCLKCNLQPITVIVKEDAQGDEEWARRTYPALYAREDALLLNVGNMIVVYQIVV